MPAPTIVCGGCEATWTAKGACHCSGCHQTFVGLTAFDAHRKRFKCLPPAEANLRLVDGVWKSAQEDDRFAKTA